MLILFSLPGTSFSQSPTATKNVTPTKKPTIADQSTTERLSDTINNLKERVASSVAKLNLVERRGIVGTVSETGSSQITITDVNGKSRIVEVDEITKFSSPTKKEGFGISDINKGMKISVIGLYNKQSRRINARYIDVVTIPSYINGMVANTDEDTFSLVVISEGGKQTTVDVETVTNTNAYADGELEKAGFSRITIGERIAVMGYPDKNDPKRIIATRILLFPGLPKNPNIIVPDKALLDKEAVTSTGSGKKLTPVR